MMTRWRGGWRCTAGGSGREPQIARDVGAASAGCGWARSNGFADLGPVLAARDLPWGEAPAPLTSSAASKDATWDPTGGRGRLRSCTGSLDPARLSTASTSRHAWSKHRRCEVPRPVRRSQSGRWSNYGQALPIMAGGLEPGRGGGSREQHGAVTSRSVRSAAGLEYSTYGRRLAADPVGRGNRAVEVVPLTNNIGEVSLGLGEPQRAGVLLAGWLPITREGQATGVPVSRRAAQHRPPSALLVYAGLGDPRAGAALEYFGHALLLPILLEVGSRCRGGSATGTTSEAVCRGWVSRSGRWSTTGRRCRSCGGREPGRGGVNAEPTSARL